MKKLEIEKTKLTFIISVLKVEYYVVLVSSISNFFTNKTSLANTCKWMSFSRSNLALKNKIFGQESTYLKGKKSIDQKLGMILENKVVQKLKLENYGL